MGVAISEDDGNTGDIFRGIRPKTSGRILFSGDGAPPHMDFSLPETQEIR